MTKKRKPPEPIVIAEEVQRAVAVGFTEADQPAALAALKRYNGLSETDRVLRAILALSDGNLAELEAMVGEANKDYRDVLYWAESPESSTVGTEKQKQMAARKMAVRWRRFGLQVPFTEK